MWFYFAYGLTFLSALPLGRLFAPTERKSADFEIGVLPPAPSTSADPSAILCVEAAPSMARLTWGTVADLIVEAGQSITVIPAPNADQDTLALFVAGAGLGVLLHQRGLLVLHASAVRAGDQIIGFVGAKGWGKSTTAMAMHCAGYQLVSDEHLVIAWSDQGNPLALPGTSPVKLWADALVSMGGAAEASPRVRSGLNKYYSSDPLPPTEQCPLQQIFLLDVGEKLAVEALSAPGAFFGVVPHLYVQRFGTPFLRSAGPELVFKQLAHLVRSVPVYRLVRRPDLSQLSEIVKLIESSCTQSLLDTVSIAPASDP